MGSNLLLPTVPTRNARLGKVCVRFGLEREQDGRSLERPAAAIFVIEKASMRLICHDLGLKILKSHDCCALVTKLPNCPNGHDPMDIATPLLYHSSGVS